MAPMSHRLLQEHSYAIVDRARAGILPDGMTLHPLVPPPLEGNAHQLPALVDLSRLKPQVFEECLGRLREEGGSDASLFCALLRCDSGFSPLRQTLRSALIAKFDGEERYFRFFDPRVFCQLAWILKPEQCCRIFGHATSWVYPLDGGWHQALKPEVAPVLRLRFSAVQVDQLDQLPMINEVIKGLRVSPLVPSALASSSASTQAYALILAARQHGLRRQDDIALFVKHGLTLHPVFYRHAVFATRITTLNHDLDYPYQHAVSDLTQDDLLRVKLETSGK